MEKKKYYVNLHPVSMDDVSPVRIPDSTIIQYEIEVTPDELSEIQTLLKEARAHDLEAHNLFTFEHFDENETIEDLNEFQHGLDKVFQKIYEFGTPVTKEQLEQMNRT
ncbi:hypothetical protein [Bacillus piscicola]|uniref:hypothetical protein n=1 Tax=Bacillus piscicola TaxID=1632684 RepID=UPI001F088DA1|nr:hypothetical protein [Bacillus piscicola]